jgi:hypothetical protein
MSKEKTYDPLLTFQKQSFLFIFCTFLRVECRLMVFENRVLRRIFGLRRDEVIGEWRRLHNKELYALYSSPSISQVNKSRKLR